MAVMTRPDREDPVDVPTPVTTPPIFRPPPEDTGPPLVPGAPAPPPAAPPVAPTSEMGEWIEEMIRQGVISRAPGNIVATSVDPGGGLGWTDTTTGLTGAGVSGTGTSPEGGSDVVGTEATPGTTPAAGDLPYPGAPAWINSNAITPEERAWYIEHKYIPPAWAGDPTVPAPLANWLRSYHSGQATMPQEYYDYFGGDQILEAIRKYDPNARWVRESMHGGEGGESAQQGLRLEFDERLMPAPAGPMGWSSPTSVLADRLHNPGMKYYDPVYGWVTDPRNNKAGKTEWWQYAAPLAISLLAPYAAPALFAAAGVPAAAAGFTSAVTGGAAGLGASNIPGSIFAAGGSGIPSAPEIGPGAGSWNPPVEPISNSTARTLMGVPRTVGGLGSQYVTPHTSGAPVRGAPPPAATTPPPVATSPTTRVPDPTAYTPQSYTAPQARAPIARNQVMSDPYGVPPKNKAMGVTTPKARGFDPYGFDPTAFNSGGSTTKPQSGDSKLVATQFAYDPYRFS